MLFVVVSGYDIHYASLKVKTEVTAVISGLIFDYHGFCFVLPSLGPPGEVQGALPDWRSAVLDRWQPPGGRGEGLRQDRLL